MILDLTDVDIARMIYNISGKNVGLDISDQIVITIGSGITKVRAAISLTPTIDYGLLMGVEKVNYGILNVTALAREKIIKAVLPFSNDFHSFSVRDNGVCIQIKNWKVLGAGKGDKVLSLELESPMQGVT